jgi:hypothetical protein
MIVVVVVVVIVLGDLKEIVFYSYEIQSRHTECDICAITKYILVHTV